ncbi:MAG: hydroxymethylbilane synthase [Synergistaceae bacterium]|jgi:hydroxymethylbilane synthase|nr:hydroxymethylbilane synthase [Synergistaceae bacterium]
MSARVSGPYRLVVSINLAGHEMLVVGGGDVARRKIKTLLGCGARVKMVSPSALTELEEMAGDGKISWERRNASPEDFASHRFVILAVRGEAAAELSAMAREARAVVDVCADGRQGDFALCAQFETEGCFVGVSSGGNDYVRAASLKRKMMKEMGGSVTILTRNSPLALVQAGMWKDALAGIGVASIARSVSSHGDRDRNSDLPSFGFGVFVKALEDELLNGRGDLAVHSLKDMPSAIREGCVLAAVLERGPVRDVLITRGGGGLDSLPGHARVGTSSVRRRAQIKSVRPDAECVKCRGNVGTRLRRLAEGEVDALVLAEAGLERLGIDRSRAAPLPFVTSAGQGAVAAEVRAGSEMEEILRTLNHAPTWYEVLAEREFLSRTGFGCVCPIGVNAEYRGGRMNMSAEVYPLEPGKHVPERASVSGAIASCGDAASLAEELWGIMRESPAVRSVMEASRR